MLIDLCNASQINVRQNDVAQALQGVLYIFRKFVPTEITLINRSFY